MTGYKVTAPPAPAGWRTDALCLQYTTDTFFPDTGSKDIAADARKICRACPVTAACLNFAMSQENGLQGVWGGTTGKDRAALRRTASAVA